MSALSLLGRLDDLEALYDGKGRELVIDNFVRSMNYDGAFGAEPGAESHGAQGMSAPFPSIFLAVDHSLLSLSYSHRGASRQLSMFDLS